MIAWLSLLGAFRLTAVVSAAPSCIPGQVSVGNTSVSTGPDFIKKSFVWSAHGDSWAVSLSFTALNLPDLADLNTERRVL